MTKVLIEIVIAAGLSTSAIFDDVANRLPGVELDRSYEPVPMRAAGKDVTLKEGEDLVIVRGALRGTTADQVKALPGIVGVWSDAKGAPFSR